MNLTLQQIEGLPASYPEVGGGIASDDAAVAWQRVERYIKVRFMPREIVWIVQGDTGEVWYPPVGPVTAIAGEFADGAMPFTLTPCGTGYRLPCGLVKLTATVGAGPIPLGVTNAVSRLAHFYAADMPVTGGVRSYSLSVGDMSESITLSPDRLAKAMQNSGAADLLRGYRSPTPWLG
jgi:hypothetical protein